MANPPSRKRSWRDAAAAPKSRPVDKSWRKDAGPARQERPWWRTRRAKLGFVFAALLMVITIIIVEVIKWRPVKPMHLVLIGPAYESNLFVPPNVAGRNGVRELKRIHEQNQWGNPHDDDALESDFGALADAIDSQSHTISRFWKTRKTVVVFVSAHGVARFENEELVPYLVPEDDDLNPKAKLYPLNAILELLAKLPDDTPKLLLLDVTQVNAHWPLGELHNDFARALNNRADDINKIKNLVVISSSDKDQRSWVAPEWGQTYFAHFLTEGLKGAADGSVNGKKNGRVDALELFTYVSKEVKHGTWSNRARTQSPVLFGTEERASKMELVACEDYPADNRIPEEKERDYKDLQTAWEKCWELRKASPHPSAYTPHLWRRYLDELLRAEQLRRGGEGDAAEKLLADVNLLHERIKESRSLELKSAQLSLPMPEGLGFQPAPQKGNGAARLADWVKQDSAKDDELNQAFAAFEKSAGNDPKRRQMYRAALAEGVFRNVMEDPEHRLMRGRRLLGMVDPVAPDCRAAETHYAMMLADYRALLRPEAERAESANGGIWPLVKTSLQLRRRAELAALGLDEENASEHLPAYSEQVLPWIHKLIESADGPRRRGQDFLFSSSPADGDKAKKLLNEEANPGYVKAQELAVKIRRALDVRDRLYAELPYYTHWVAEFDFEHETDVVQLWGELHKLRSLLEKPATGAEGSAKVAEVDKLRQHIAEDFQRIQGRVEESANKENPANQERWHEIEAALAVPFLRPDVRLSLIQASRDISGKLFQNLSKENAEDIAGGDLKEAKTRGLRQGRLALAVLSDDWPESATIKRELDIAVDERWPNPLARAGAAVGQLLNRLPEEADTKCEAARQANLDKAAELLQSAARFARTVEGAAARTRMAQNPLDEQRHLNLHDLLCWQAHRTYLDWWAELPQPRHALPMRPYYQRAGAIFLEDAGQLVMGKVVKSNQAARSPRLKRVDEEQANLRPVPMIVERSERRSKAELRPGPARFYWTDEDDVEWLYCLQGPKTDQVPGDPVVWVKTEGGLRVSALDAQRRPIVFNDPFRVKITEAGPPDRLPTGVARHSVEGFFRGHRSQVETSVYLPERPDRVVSLPPLQGRGHVAVQTKKGLYDIYGAQNTAIALVLDCSGSMEPAPMPNSRFKRALRVLRGVLKQLPKGVTVSLRTFGAEKYIETVENPYGIHLEWPARPWDPDGLDTRIAEVEKLKPYGFTPLVRSIATAKNDLPDEKKARSIVVITDGGDSTFYKDNRRKGDTIKSFLRREFADSDIQVSVIGFEAKESELLPEEKEGYKEFRPALEAIHGQYYDAENIELLTEYLTRSLLHMYFQVYPDAGRDEGDRREKGENITQSDKEKNWRWVHLPPDFYRIRIPSIRSIRQQRIEVRPGEALLLDLVGGRSGPEFRRGTYAESEIFTRGRSRTWMDKSQKDWLLAVLQNEQLPESTRLQLMTTLEKTDQTLSPAWIQQIHPGWVWFDVSAPAGTNSKLPLRITSLPDYPADAWGIDVKGWPVDGPAAALKTWWIEPAPRPRAQLFKGLEFESLRDLPARPWLTNPPLGNVALEGVQLKRCDIQVEDRTYKDVNCLMVRLSYPPEKEPFFVRVRFSNEPDRKIGVEDRFYTSAGKYTGIFWPVTEKVVNSIERLELFSVADLKKSDPCHCVEKLELDRPSDRFKRPPSARPISEEP